MNLDPEDEKLEAYLKQFHALPPKPLVADEKRVVGRPALLFAAVIVLVVAIFVQRRVSAPAGRGADLSAQNQPIAQEISVIRLSRIAQEDPGKLGSRLDELSSRLLPDVSRSEGVLKQLARQ